MARRQTPSPAGEASQDFVENIVDIDVTSEMEGSFLEMATTTAVTPWYLSLTITLNLNPNSHPNMA